VPQRSRASWTWGFALVLTGLTLALHWRLLVRFGSAIPSDPGDPLLNIWILWWNAHHVPFTAAYWNAPIFAPAPYALALSETLLGLTWVTTPLQWLGASPLVAYNTLFVATPILNGLSAYWLCLTLTKRPDAAAIGGLAFAFAPYHASQLAHIQTEAMFWMPVALVGLHNYWSTGQRKWLVCLGAATAMNALTCGYFLLYFAVFLSIAILWLTIASGTRAKVIAVATTLAISALPLVPVALTYRFVRRLWNLSRPITEIQSFGADVVATVLGADRLVFWPVRGPEWQLPGGLYPQYPGVVIALLVLAGAGVAFRRRRRDHPHPRWRRGIVVLLVAAAAFEFAAACVYWVVGPWAVRLGPIDITLSRPYAAVGLAIALLIVATIVSPRFTALVRSGSLPGLYATGAGVAGILALGPVGRVAGHRFWSVAPFEWLMPLPGFDAARVPALFFAITVLCLAVLAACALDWLIPRATRRSLAFTGALAAAIVLDGWAIMPVVDAPGPIPSMTGELIVELPRIDRVFDDTAAMYRAMRHERPIVNGYSGYYPPHYEWLIDDLRNYCVDSLDAVRGGRSLDVILWRRRPGAGALDNEMTKLWGQSGREDTIDMVLYHVPRTRVVRSPIDEQIDLSTFCTDTRAHGPRPY
jgi:hypothetical protein